MCFFRFGGLSDYPHIFSGKLPLQIQECGFLHQVEGRFYTWRVSLEFRRLRSLGLLKLFLSFPDLDGKGNGFLIATHSFGSVQPTEHLCSSLLLALHIAFTTFVTHLLGNFKFTFCALCCSIEASQNVLPECVKFFLFHCSNYNRSFSVISKTKLDRNVRENTG